MNKLRADGVLFQELISIRAMEEGRRCTGRQTRSFRPCAVVRLWLKRNSAVLVATSLDHQQHQYDVESHRQRRTYHGGNNNILVEWESQSVFNVDKLIR